LLSLKGDDFWSRFGRGFSRAGQNPRSAPKPDLKSGVVVGFDQIQNEAMKQAIDECGLPAFTRG
jgi:hypothetical protein